MSHNNDNDNNKNSGKCPFRYQQEAASKEPTKLNLKALQPTLHFQHDNYASNFQKLDIQAVEQDIRKVLTTSQDWWPADYGHYGPLMIRLAWHSAGTYRTFDGRGGGNAGNMRFSPLDSWPDNGNLDKARRLLWPIKKKYGKLLSWGDLLILAGNVSLESMGFPCLGFGGGRIDCWEPEEDIYWGPEEEMLADERHSGGKLEEPLAADHMGLIYVNPEGPSGVPDPSKSAMHIRDTFGRMGMNDQETVALIAGGHTFGKSHGAAPPDAHVGPAPKDASVEEQGFGWQNKYKSGKGAHTITSGLEGAWTTNPILWDNGYFDNLFGYDWKLTTGPGGAKQWTPKQQNAANVPDAHDPNKKHAPVMFTTDIALKVDPSYARISKRFHEHPEEFKEAFAKAWYKLTHRDMGPHTRLLGNNVPPPQPWQDPLPGVYHTVVDQREIAELKTQILGCGLPISVLVNTAWASASTFRVTDFRGGANGARIRLAPQKEWPVNDPARLARVLKTLESIQAGFHRQVSMADLIVLGGCAAIEQAAKLAGKTIQVPFQPGRADAVQEDTNVESFSVLEPIADGFRNFNSTAHQLVDKAHMLSLTAPEMTALVGGLRVLGANTSLSTVGVLTRRPETLTNDFFVHLLDMSLTWKKTPNDNLLYEGCDDSTGMSQWMASQVDLAFGSNAELRAIAEYYACDESRFVQDFVEAWTKVMNLDRFDLPKKNNNMIRSSM